jgi:hypothetical protein
MTGVRIELELNLVWLEWREPEVVETDEAGGWGRASIRGLQGSKEASDAIEPRS